MPDLINALAFLSGLFYLGGGLVGWVLCFAARRSRRYHPPISLAGLAIGLLPTYLLLLRLLRQWGLVASTTDVWQYVALCLVCGATVVTGATAYYYVLQSNRQERAERAQQGC